MKLLKIGRDASCDIVIYSEKVSSIHAELTLLNNGDMLLEDKGSRNGTYVMNRQIAPNTQVNVRRGDAIRFGDVELQWGQIPMPDDNSAYKAVYGIGSHPSNDIRLSGATVSRYHATAKLGRDGKMYIVDHSKNGTTINGAKIASNRPYQIKKSSVVVCGGAPVDMKCLPWPKNVWRRTLAIAASVMLLAGIGIGVWLFISSRTKEMDDKELYARYNNSVVMLMGIYHYEVSIGNRDMNDINRNLRKYLGREYEIPEKVLWDDINKVPIDVSGISQKNLVEAFDKKGIYTGTGFFISDDGQLITNLHVVKPWLFNNIGQLLQDYYSARLAGAVEILNRKLGATTWSALVPQLKVEGKLDYIALLPQGETYDPDNIIKCKVLSAGSDINKDVALIQTVSKRLPTSKCTTVNVQDSIDVSEEALTVGEHVYTIGFPTGMNYEGLIQKDASDNGIQVVGQGGSINQHASQFDFGYNAQTTGGASGSPVFNKYGMLVGVHHQGTSSVETQGFNYGVKAKFVKELLETPYIK